MRFSSEASAETPEINLTPLIDVVFLLLIFFMVSTTFQHTRALQVALPEASRQSAAERAPTEIELTIEADGRMAVNGEPLDNNGKDNIRAALRSLLEQPAKQPLTIRADREVAHKHVVRAMDVAAGLGLVNVAIATRTAMPERQ